MPDRREPGKGKHVAADDPRTSDRVGPPEIEVRRDFVEISMDLARLVAAFGPDMLLQVPALFRGARNALTARDLISLHAAGAPGFVAELRTADPLRCIAFRVAGAREQEFLDAMRAVVREVLIEPRGIGAVPASPRAGCGSAAEGLPAGRRSGP
jgi:hypothetical protein